MYWTAPSASRSATLSAAASETRSRPSDMTARRAASRSPRTDPPLLPATGGSSVCLLPRPVGQRSRPPRAKVQVLRTRTGPSISANIGPCVLLSELKVLHDGTSSGPSVFHWCHVPDSAQRTLIVGVTTCGRQRGGLACPVSPVADFRDLRIRSAITSAPDDRPSFSSGLGGILSGRRGLWLSRRSG